MQLLEPSHQHDVRELLAPSDVRERGPCSQLGLQPGFVLKEAEYSGPWLPRPALGPSDHRFIACPPDRFLQIARYYGGQ